MGRSSEDHVMDTGDHAGGMLNTLEKYYGTLRAKRRKSSLKDVIELQERGNNPQRAHSMVNSQTSPALAPSSTTNIGEPPPATHRHNPLHRLSGHQSKTHRYSAPLPLDYSLLQPDFLHGVHAKPSVPTMPAEKGWRKRLQGEKRPKTPTLSKPAAAPEEASAADDQSDRASDKASIDQASDHFRLQQPPEKHGWMNSFLGSRPQTPVRVSTPTTVTSFPLFVDDTEEGPRSSETGAETPTSRGKTNGRPHFSRYMSEYLVLAQPPKRPPKELFSQFWTDEEPFEYPPPVDPEVALQAIRSHISNHSLSPLPPSHYSGLLRIFEDYRKVREVKENLEDRLKQALDAWESAQEEWTAMDDTYQAEIRRLELHIAKGKTGMSGLMKARQGTVVGRRRVRRQSLSNDRDEGMYRSLSRKQIDDEIKQKVQKVVYHRPSSPSAGMAALSKKLRRTGSSEELPVGTPPDSQLHRGLTRKVKSELDLTKTADLISSVTTSPQSGQSGPSDSATSGVTLPGEVSMSDESTTAIGVECEAFVALRELATLVARRRGFDPEAFYAKFMQLYSTENEAKKQEEEQSRKAHSLTDHSSESSPEGTNQGSDIQLLAGRVRQTQSDSQLPTKKTLRRHFSFEPGDDELGVLNEELRRFELSRPKSPAGSQSTVSSASEEELDKASEHSPNPSRTQTLGAEVPKPSKIPSPLNRPSLSRTRRESSASSLQTVKYKVDDNGKRDSRSSVLTAFRENSSGSLRRPDSTSRSNSMSNLHQTDNDDSRDSKSSLKVRNSMAAVAAARAAESASNSAANSMTNNAGKDRRHSAKPPRARKESGPRRGRSSENHTPQTRG